MKQSVQAISLCVALLFPCFLYAGVESVFMDLKKECNVAETTNEGSYALTECPPFEGYKLITENSDGKTTVTLGFGSQKNALNSGYAFSEFGNMVEWRAKTIGKKREPLALIFRMFYSNPAGELSVVRLAQGRSCVIGQIDAKKVKNANEAARRLADDEAKSCN